MAAVQHKLSRLQGRGDGASARASPVPFGALAAAMPASTLGGAALTSSATAALTSAAPSSGAPTAAAHLSHLSHLSPATRPLSTASPELSLGLMSSDLRQLAKATAEGAGAGAAAGAAAAAAAARLPTRMSASISARQQRQNIQMYMTAAAATAATAGAVSRATTPDFGASIGRNHLYTTQGALGGPVLAAAKRSVSPEVPKSRFFGSATVPNGSGRLGGGGGWGGAALPGDNGEDEEPRDLFGRSTGSMGTLTTAFTPAKDLAPMDPIGSPSEVSVGHRAADPTHAAAPPVTTAATAATAASATAATATATPVRAMPVDSVTHERRELLKALLGRKAIPIPSFLSTAPAGTFGSPAPVEEARRGDPRPEATAEVEAAEVAVEVEAAEAAEAGEAGVALRRGVAGASTSRRRPSRRWKKGSLGDWGSGEREQQKQRRRQKK